MAVQAAMGNRERAHVAVLSPVYGVQCTSAPQRNGLRANRLSRAKEKAQRQLTAVLPNWRHGIIMWGDGVPDRCDMPQDGLPVRTSNTAYCGGGRRSAISRHMKMALSGVAIGLGRCWACWGVEIWMRRTTALLRPLNNNTMAWPRYSPPVPGLALLPTLAHDAFGITWQCPSRYGVENEPPSTQYPASLHPHSHCVSRFALVNHLIVHAFISICSSLVLIYSPQVGRLHL
jgi:hypothetical protein